MVELGDVYMRVALTQMDIQWENKEENAKTCRKLVKEAASQNSDIILFPETTLTGFSNHVTKIADKNNETIDFFSELAKEYNLAIGFGYVSMPDEKGRNHFAVVDSDGSIRMDYIKIHPFCLGGEAEFYEGGDQFGCFELPGEWQCAGFVCYDLRFPESFQKLPDRDVIFLIANWPKSRIEQWYALLRARAIEMQCFVVGVNRIGEGNGLIYPKSSVVYNYKGQEVSLVDTKDTENLYVDIKWNGRRAYRDAFPVRNDRRKGIDYE